MASTKQKRTVKTTVLGEVKKSTSRKRNILRVKDAVEYNGIPYVINELHATTAGTYATLDGRQGKLHVSLLKLV